MSAFATRSMTLRWLMVVMRANSSQSWTLQGITLPLNDFPGLRPDPPPASLGFLSRLGLRARGLVNNRLRVVPPYTGAKLRRSLTEFIDLRLSRWPRAMF